MKRLDDWHPHVAGRGERGKAPGVDPDADAVGASGMMGFATGAELLGSDGAFEDVVGGGDRVVTRVLALGAPERREEIARMLAGAEITREARAAAKSLIEKAG